MKVNSVTIGNLESIGTYGFINRNNNTIKFSLDLDEDGVISFDVVFKNTNTNEQNISVSDILNNHVNIFINNFDSKKNFLYTTYAIPLIGQILNNVNYHYYLDISAKVIKKDTNMWEFNFYFYKEKL